MKKRSSKPRSRRLATLRRAAWLALAVAALPAAAEMEKNAVAGTQGIQLFWWPRLPAVEGWIHDRPTSLQYGAYMLVPRGKTFAEAEAVIYAKAMYKPRAPQISSLGQLIERDRKEFEDQPGGAKARDAERLYTADAQPLACLLFEPTGGGNWERVCYLEEGDYYVLFTLSSRSRAAFESTMKTYVTLINRYRP
jgi:hypothetical protein